MPTPDRHSPRVGIIGTGFSGVAAAVELRRRGIRSVTLLEKADEVGGVWRDNTYPGAACDVPSHLYSFSWAPNPAWSLKFAPQAEIRAYLQRVAREQGLLPHCRFGVEVARATWDTDRATWTVEATDGQVWVFDVLLTGTGQLSRPAIPDLPGVEDFAGPSFHSAEWDHDVDLTGRRVVVIGTGASAIQFVPHVAEVAGHVTVVQRSAPWVVPKPDRPYRRAEKVAFAHVPGWDRIYRSYLYVRSEGRWPAFSGNPLAAKAAETIATRHLRRGVAEDPGLADRLLPDERIGCKRILQSDDWFPTLARDHVDVVDGRVVAVERDAVVLDDGTRLPCDVILYGTGFHTTELLAPMEIVGRDGVTLDDAWRRGAEAYLGTEVAGFPNLFVMYGPNTNLGHNSIIFMLECQARYVGQAIERLGDHDLASVEVRDDVHRAFNDTLQDRLRDSVWNAGCASWYVDANGRIINNWVGTTLEYRWRTRRYDPAVHHLVRRSELPVRTDHTAPTTSTAEVAR